MTEYIIIGSVVCIIGFSYILAFVWGYKTGKGQPVAPKKGIIHAQDDRKEFLEELKRIQSMSILSKEEKKMVEEYFQDDEKEAKEEATRKLLEDI